MFDTDFEQGVNLRIFCAMLQPSLRHVYAGTLCVGCKASTSLPGVALSEAWDTSADANAKKANLRSTTLLELRRTGWPFKNNLDSTIYAAAADFANKSIDVDEFVRAV